MGNALAIAAVTAVLKDLLNNGLIDHNVTGAVGGNVTVSALPPDRVFAPGTQEGNQLNLFLYQVAPNVGWRNVGLPSRDERGGRLTPPARAAAPANVGAEAGEQRLQKVLARAGIASRRHAEELIVAGRVSVGGKVVRVLGARVDPARDSIEVDGRAIAAEPLTYVLFHKPRGVVSTLIRASSGPGIGAKPKKSA